MPKQTLLVAAMTVMLFSTSAHASWWEEATGIFDSLKKELGGDSDTSTVSEVIGQLSSADIEKAFRQALSLGSEAVVKQLSVKNGFNADPKVHIPLPPQLQDVKGVLDKFGLGSYADDVELKLNRAAEAAAPEAKGLFINAIKQMSFEDVRAIYKGPEDSGTQYLKQATSSELKQKMEPIIQTKLNEVGAVQSYDQAMAKYKNLPFVPDIKADLTNHVMDKALEGMFFYLAKEEAAIRQDPVKQTTELLKKVFGQP